MVRLTRAANPNSPRMLSRKKRRTRAIAGGDVKKAMSKTVGRVGLKCEVDDKKQASTFD